MFRFFLIAFFLLLLGVGCDGQSPSDKVLGIKERYPALARQKIDFTLKDFFGQTVRLSDYRGKFVIVGFWQTLCTRCLSQMDELVKLQEKYSDTLIVVGVNRGDNEGVSKEMLERMDLRGKFIALLDPGDSVYPQARGDGMPFLVFVGTEGDVRTTKSDFLEIKELEKTAKEIFRW